MDVCVGVALCTMGKEAVADLCCFFISKEGPLFIVKVTGVQSN